MQLSVNPEVVHGFEVSRRKVVEALSNMNFAKIVSIVQLPNKLDPSEPHFQGEVEEVFASKHRTAPKHAFFSRFSRNTQGVSVLGCFTIVDTPMGTCQASALPQLGDVLVGSFVEAGRKGKIPFEFKGWCNNGKPLLELLRVLQFGTRMSSKELHTLLRQPASITAAFALRLNANTTASQRRHAEKVSKSVDDIWNIARALCFKDLSLDESLKTSVSHWDMMTQLAMVTLDEEFLDELNKIKPACEIFVPDPVEFTAQRTMAYGLEFGGGQGQGYGGYAAPYGASTTLPQPSDFGSKTPEYNIGGGGKTPPYRASSPSFLPSSPGYAPSSPVSKSPPRLLNSEGSVHSNSSLEDTAAGLAPRACTIQEPAKFPNFSTESPPGSPKYSPESPPESPKYSPESPVKDILGMLPKFDVKESPVQLQLPVQMPTPHSIDLLSPATTSSTKTQKKPTTTRKKKSEEMEVDGEPKKKITKRKRGKSEANTFQANPVLYSPSQPSAPSQPALYSPSSLPFSTTASQHPFSPSTSIATSLPVQASSAPTTGKLLLGSLLAKINSPKPVKMDIVSYEDI